MIKKVKADKSFKSKEKFTYYLRLYLWMLPAFILVFSFLLLPTLNTILLSFQEKQTFSESVLRKEMLEDLSKNAGTKIDRYSYITEIQGWEIVVAKIAVTRGISIDMNEITEDMTVQDTIEFLSIPIQQKIKNESKIKFSLNNYIKMFTDSAMHIAFKNNLLWLLLFTFGTVLLGLFLATLIDKVVWAPIAKIIVFVPMAISFVASSVIWSFMYDKDPNIGTLNAFLNGLSKFYTILTFDKCKITYEPVAFLGKPETVNFALIFAGIWMWVGFCMVIFNAALKSIPKDIKESALLEGATTFQAFFLIEVPMIFPTITVVTTTMVINVLKIFDVVYTMTGGGPFGSSEVIANRLYRTAFNENNYEYASAMAVILLIAVIPVMLGNIKSYYIEEKTR